MTFYNLSRVIGTILVFALFLEAIQLGAALIALPSDIAVIASLLLLVISSYVAYKLTVRIWR